MPVGCMLAPLSGTRRQLATFPLFACGLGLARSRVRNPPIGSLSLSILPSSSSRASASAAAAAPAATERLGRQQRAVDEKLAMRGGILWAPGLASGGLGRR
ncbi:hypothetical protein HPB50_003600 [Hyalomma asiaticum]|uniref:Uncharacterized protein n=1 Tax=Hyalomma asiaticum TaxID=266040 RepID=A0ACB7T195_HYAAI|nr:hypothetical protein HPB50_003600 [Hyalomma asiaticum]